MSQFTAERSLPLSKASSFFSSRNHLSTASTSLSTSHEQISRCPLRRRIHRLAARETRFFHAARNRTLRSRRGCCSQQPSVFVRQLDDTCFPAFSPRTVVSSLLLHANNSSCSGSAKPTRRIRPRLSASAFAIIQYSPAIPIPSRIPPNGSPLATCLLELSQTSAKNPWRTSVTPGILSRSL